MEIYLPNPPNLNKIKHQIILNELQVGLGLPSLRRVDVKHNIKSLPHLVTNPVIPVPIVTQDMWGSLSGKQCCREWGSPGKLSRG